MVTVVLASGLAAFLGYAVSSKTGVEPGYFEAAETGGYGGSAGGGGEAVEIDDEMRDYYKTLKVE